HSPTATTTLRPLAFGAVAFVLALAGTMLLGPDGTRFAGVILLGAAGLLAIAAWGRPNKSEELKAQERLSVGPGTARPSRQEGWIAVASLVLLAFSNVAFLLDSSNTFGPAGVLWLIAITPLVAVSVRAYAHLARSSGAESERRAREDEGVRHESWSLLEIAAFIVISGIALLLRVWNLSAYPYNIYPDEIMTGQVAAQAFGANPKAPIFSTVWGGIDLPALWFYLVWISTRVAGSTLEALRLPAALFGAATVLPMYMMLRDNWGKYAATAGATMLAVGAADVHYSRIALNNIVPQFFWTCCFLFLLRAVRSGKWFYWLAAGLSGGLSEHFYYGTRLLPFLLLAFLGYLLITRRRFWRMWASGFVWILWGYVAGMGPLLAYYAQHPALYLGRGAGMLVWNRQSSGVNDVIQIWNALWPPFAETLLGISTHTSQDIVYFAPLLLPIEAALLVLGAAIVAWKWRSPANFLLLMAGLGVLVVGGTLALYADAPFLAHWTPAFPVLYAAAAIPLGLACKAIRGATNLRARAFIAPLALGACLVGLAWANVDFYFARYYADPELLRLPNYRTSQEGYEIQTVQSRFQASLGPSTQVITVGGAGHVYDPVTTGYLVHGQQEKVLPDPAALSTVNVRTSPITVFLFFPPDEPYLPAVQAMFPGGQSLDITTPAGKHVFTAYRIGP
ncbi:MAG TPA: glycosyltransferase family 39 protein, partial [Chloroflexia bacterium]|nr:glycosyltransferase family 39 protein [Chloroflexia bacterium]